MSDLISKSELKKLLTLNNKTTQGILYAVIDSCKTIDAVPVVRCEECKRAYMNQFAKESKVVLCKLITNFAGGKQQIRQFDDFCSYGERKDGEK